MLIESNRMRKQTELISTIKEKLILAKTYALNTERIHHLQRSLQDSH